MCDKKFPRVGVGAFIQKDGKVLLGKRIQKHGLNQWSFPGGAYRFLRGSGNEYYSRD